MKCVDLGESFPTSYSNEYLLDEIGVDTAEIEPLEVWGKFFQYYSFVSLIIMQDLQVVDLRALPRPTPRKEETSSNVIEK